MTVAASKVKSLCTGAEIDLVRASRKQELEKHSASELKALASRARKSFDKWQAQGREQARSQARQAGLGEKAANTKLKVQIFREALDAFEARLAKVTKQEGAKKAAKPNKTKQARAAEHRQSRAAVRTGMTAALDLSNQSRATKAKRANAAKATKPAKVAKPAAKKGVSKVSPAAEAATPPADRVASAKPTKKKLAAKKPTKKAPAKPVQTLNAKKQLRAATVAKQARVDKSGKTSRVLGHVSARGKRAQARRDSKN